MNFTPRWFNFTIMSDERRHTIVMVTVSTYLLEAFVVAPIRLLACDAWIREPEYDTFHARWRWVFSPDTLPCVRLYRYSAISGLGIMRLLMTWCHFKYGRENGYEVKVKIGNTFQMSPSAFSIHCLHNLMIQFFTMGANPIVGERRGLVPMRTTTSTTPWLYSRLPLPLLMAPNNNHPLTTNNIWPGVSIDNDTEPGRMNKSG